MASALPANLPRVEHAAAPEDPEVPFLAQCVCTLLLWTSVASALWLRGDDKLAPATAAVYRCIRKEIPPIEKDVVMHPLMNAAEAMVKDGRILRAAESVCGELE